MSTLPAAPGVPPWWRRPQLRARAADALYLGVGAVATATEALEAYRPHGLAAAIVIAVACGVGAVALLWRRRLPILVALVGLPSTYLAQLGMLPLGLLALAIRRRDRVLWLVAAAGLTVSLLQGAPAHETNAGTIVSNLLTLGLAMAVGAFVGARRDLLASLRARAEQAEAALALRADQARLAERTRIAQEMHDVLAHRISLIGLHAGGLEVRPDSGAAVVERSAALIRQTARSALEDLRSVLGVLRSDGGGDVNGDLAPQPQLGDLPRLVAASSAAGVGVTLLDELPAGAADLPEVAGRTVYRLVQEALTNVHKHARDAATTVRLTGAPGDGIVVEVVNVRPVSAETLQPGAGVGLVGLRERVGLAGGTLDAGPTPAGGWRVRAWFPWPT